MTREDLKKHWEVIQAFKEGAELEWLDSDKGCWEDCPCPEFYHELQYRAKPAAPEYIPFDFSDAERLIGKAVKGKGLSIVRLITEVGLGGVYAEGRYSFLYLSENFTFLDGAPCGKVVENGAV